MISIIGVWRFRNKVLHRMDFIFSTMGPSRAKLVLKANFQRNWRKVIRSLYDQGVPPDEASATLSVMCIRGIFRRVTQDQKDLALFALRNDNRANVTANHLRSIHAGISLYGSPAVAKSASFEIFGVLEGLDGKALDDYRLARLLDETFGEAGWDEASKDARDFWQGAVKHDAER